MREPENHAVLVDKFGDSWVRYDEWPATSWGQPPWVPLTDGPHWDERARNSVGTPLPWHQVDGTYNPLSMADRERAARALERVRQEARRDD